MFFNFGVLYGYTEDVKPLVPKYYPDTGSGGKNTGSYLFAPKIDAEQLVSGPYIMRDQDFFRQVS